MNADKIIDAIGDVDDRYITEAMEYKVKKKPRRVWKVAVAACLCIAILGQGLVVTAVAKERDYYKDLYTSSGLVDQGDNLTQIAQACISRTDSLTSTKGYILTVTTDKTNYTIDEYIYVTARIDNVSDVELNFSAARERYGVFSIRCNYAEDLTVRLYDTSYNRYDIDSDSFTDNEIKQIALAPGEYYAQTFRFSTKYISEQPDFKPVLAEENLPLGMYVIYVQTNNSRCGLGFVRIPVTIIEES